MMNGMCLMNIRPSQMQKESPESPIGLFESRIWYNKLCEYFQIQIKDVQDNMERV